MEAVAERVGDDFVGEDARMPRVREALDPRGAPDGLEQGPVARAQDADREPQRYATPVVGLR